MVDVVFALHSSFVHEDMSSFFWDFGISDQQNVPEGSVRSQRNFKVRSSIERARVPHFRLIGLNFTLNVQ
jgi:hypothetical protein